MTRMLLVIAALLVLPAAWTQAAGQHEGVVNTDGGVAIHGYDAVAYHTLGEPTEGSAEFSAEWDGAQWWFVSAEHRDLFADDPERYTPKYGGYCAQAAAQNNVADANPELWTIEEGRLYLNANRRFYRRFLDDLSANIAAADRNWPELRAELAAATR